MSWRTTGRYDGLSERDKRWLKRFNKRWDTKDCGRSQVDALERMSSEWLHQYKTHLEDLLCSDSDKRESLLYAAVSLIERITTPRELKNAWSIHIYLQNQQKIICHFEDRSEAQQVYFSIKEIYQLIQAFREDF
jgi:hypothetical protein